MLEQKGIYAVLKNNLSLLEGLEFTLLRVLEQKGMIPGTTYIRTWYVYQHFLFDFPFDEIYRRLLFFTLGRMYHTL